MHLTPPCHSSVTHLSPKGSAGPKAPPPWKDPAATAAEAERVAPKASGTTSLRPPCTCGHGPPSAVARHIFPFWGDVFLHRFLFIRLKRSKNNISVCVLWDSNKWVLDIQNVNILEIQLIPPPHFPEEQTRAERGEQSSERRGLQRKFLKVPRFITMNT